MAHLEDLIAEVESSALRGAIADEIRLLKKRMRFGLVFERHIPETALLAPSVGLRVGDEVRLRSEALEGGERLLVDAVKGRKVTVHNDEGVIKTVPADHLMVVKAFGEPVYPTLVPVGAVPAHEDAPHHLVIEGENFHALQVLQFTCHGSVDCIYIDPPYNTGAPDWKYNNRYVDDNDRWRHSKWLSMMERRLRLARDLLKPDGVLIVTIDEHEVSHLGVLLEQLFPDTTRQMVTIVINPKGVTEERLSRVEEYAYFCFSGKGAVSGLGDDLLTPMTDEEIAATEGARPRWKGLLRSGTNARREDRKNMFFPVLIDPAREAVLGAGEPLDYPKKPNRKAKIDGLVPVWPIRKDKSLGNWGVGHVTLRELIGNGYVKLGNYDKKRETWGFSYLSRRLREQVDAGVLQKLDYDERRNVVDVAYVDPRMRRVKRVWHRSSHDAGAGGSDLLRRLLGGGDRRFAFPKSLYAVRDTLAAVVGDNPDALILDFFAGSATTLHATAYLNAQDAGRRRCIIVTNNEVSAAEGKELASKGHYPGDAEFEKHGVFEAVAHPRLQAALTGKLPDGSTVPGKYLDGRAFSNGFVDGCQFFRLAYLNPAHVELGQSFEALHPLAWLMAGGNCNGPIKLSRNEPFVVLPESGYAVLFDTVALPDLLEALGDQPSVDHVFLLTDSEQAYTDMASSLQPRKTTMLPRDYLRHFRAAGQQ
jgi:adenine-specific DNA-methyltransferase